MLRMTPFIFLNFYLVLILVFCFQLLPENIWILIWLNDLPAMPLWWSSWRLRPWRCLLRRRYSYSYGYFLLCVLSSLLTKTFKADYWAKLWVDMRLKYTTKSYSFGLIFSSVNFDLVSLYNSISPSSVFLNSKELDN